MTAAVAATVSPFQVILSGEDHEPVFEIKISGRELRYGLLRGLTSVKGVYAVTTDTDLIPMGFSNTREKLRWNDNIVAPTSPLVGLSGTLVTLVQTTAKRALQGLE